MPDKYLNFILLVVIILALVVTARFLFIAGKEDSLADKLLSSGEAGQLFYEVKTSRALTRPLKLKA